MLVSDDKIDGWKGEGDEMELGEVGGFTVGMGGDLNVTALSRAVHLMRKLCILPSRLRVEVNRKMSLPFWEKDIFWSPGAGLWYSLGRFT